MGLRFTLLTLRIVKTLLFGVLSAFVTALVFFVLYLDSRPDLQHWHLADLDEEYTADHPAASFAEYLELEQHLFRQLDNQVYAETPPEFRRLVNRYHRGSLADPTGDPNNWNRSFEIPAADAKVGVLLLHGMSDSPYSLRAIGQSLNAAGAWLVGLRLPGHGTAPSGLVDVKWEDMAAAVRLAMLHLRERLGASLPIYIIGYSNGGALGMYYALSAVDGLALPRVSGLVLISPAIGVTKVAGLAVWQARLGHLLGLEKLAWNSILPEYDPYKYGSFAVNAGDQVYRLTEEIQHRIDGLKSRGTLNGMPPILAFSSVVDATVSTMALVEGLFFRLPAGGHELVLFDINRETEIEPLLNQDPGADIQQLMHDDHPFRITLITNRSEEDPEVVARTRRSGSDALDERLLGMKWPGDLYSLSHVALPFAPDDPVYGGRVPSGVKSRYRLGDMAPRGERGVLAVPASDMLRLRWNPFYSYLERRVLAFTGLLRP